jgi:hypothetical protein
MEWLILAIFLLFLFGRAQRSSTSSYPTNQYSGNLTCNIGVQGANSGDTFGSCTGTIVAGVCQPSRRVILPSTRGLKPPIILPIHAIAPVCAPPPLQITAPLKTVSVLPKLAPLPISSCQKKTVYGNPYGPRGLTRY